MDKYARVSGTHANAYIIRHDDAPHHVFLRLNQNVVDITLHTNRVNLVVNYQSKACNYTVRDHL